MTDGPLTVNATLEARLGTAGDWTDLTPLFGGYQRSDIPRTRRGGLTQGTQVLDTRNASVNVTVDEDDDSIPLFAGTWGKVAQIRERPEGAGAGKTQHVWTGRLLTQHRAAPGGVRTFQVVLRVESHAETTQ